MQEIYTRSIREALAESFSNSSDDMSPSEADDLALSELKRIGLEEAAIIPKNPKLKPARRVKRDENEIEIAVVARVDAHPAVVEAKRTVTVGSSYRHGDGLLLLATPFGDYFNGKFVRDRCRDIPPLLAHLAVPTLVAGFALFERAMNEYDKFVDRVVYGMKPRTVCF